jgi:hypothetical protein
MSIDGLAFCFGGLLLFVASIGGGFELKELKVPRLTWLPRAIFGSIGVAFILLGIGMQQMADEKKQGPTISSASEPPPDVRPEPVAPVPEKHAVQQTGPQLATGFAGITGHALVAWCVGSGRPYVARLQLDGERGVADVEFQINTGTIVVRQDLTLVPNSVGWLYVGSNPRDAARRGISRSALSGAANEKVATGVRAILALMTMSVCPPAGCSLRPFNVAASSALSSTSI